MHLNLEVEQPTSSNSLTHALRGVERGEALTAVELFCGIGGFRIAADRLGLRTVWANDFCPLACSVYRDRFGADVLHEGDINCLLDSIPPHDVLTGGFPCQPFSAAGKKEGVRDPRGTLFQSIVDVLADKRPRVFVLENVKRLLSMENGTHFATVLSALSSLDYFIEWRVLNAKDFGLAQNRERVIIIGTRIGNSIDKRDARSALRLATSADTAHLPHRQQKSLDAWSTWHRIANHKAKFPIWGAALDGHYVAFNLPSFSDRRPATTLAAILEAAPAPEYDYTEQTLERLHMNQPVGKFVNGVEIVSNQAGGARMGYTIFGIHGVAPTLTASTSRHYERYQIGARYRRLTPREYARIQGFPDDHCSAAKAYDQYSLFGNAAPPVLVEWALDRALNGSGVAAAPELEIQPELFSA